MSMTDPIADMLTRIRNACGSKHRRVDMPVSKMKIEIARILKENNFIQDYATVETEDGRQAAARACSSTRGRPAGHPRSCSASRRPVCASTSASTEIPRVRNGLGMAILSTSKGLMSDRAGASGAHRRRAPRPRLVRRRHTCHESEKHRSPSRTASRSRSDGNTVTVKGPKGELTRTLPAGDARSTQENGTVTVNASVGRGRSTRRCTA